jgi:hypothetical protein
MGRSNGPRGRHLRSYLAIAITPKKDAPFP